MSDQEQWLPVRGFGEFYEVSSLGRVRSFSRYVNHINGSRRLIRGRMLTGAGSYPRVHLFGKGISRQVDVHRLVLDAFVGPCPDGMEGCHNDGNPRNARLDNLRWDTHVSNLRDCIGHQTTNRGERNGQSRLLNSEVLEIRQLLAQGKPKSEIAKRFGVSKTTIWEISSGRKWKHVA